jgi:hypothetical protein
MFFMTEWNAFGPETLLSLAPQLSDSTCLIFMVFEAQNQCLWDSGLGYAL